MKKKKLSWWFDITGLVMVEMVESEKGNGEHCIIVPDFFTS